jgi:ABC-type molybdenum transport system ATPase subunit/photorepair protein PhrA
MADSIIELKNVSTVYEGERVPAIRDIDLTIESGEFVAIIGPNGAGKTTLLETINGLLPHTRGQVRVLGRDVARFGPQLRSQIGYVPQEFQFDETTPVLVRDVVLMGRYGRIGLFRRPTAEDYAQVQEALELLGLAELAERPLGKLSGGQQQKVLLARALAKEPKILLLRRALQPSRLCGARRSRRAHRALASRAIADGAPRAARSGSNPPELSSSRLTQWGTDTTRWGARARRAGFHRSLTGNDAMYGLPWSLIITLVSGAALTGAACGLLGTFVVRLRLSSLGFTMSHAAFAGAALGLALGVSSR